MSKIKNFSKPTLTKFRKEFSDAVKDLEKEYGVKIDLGNIRFTNEQFTTKLTTTIVGDGDAEEIKAKKVIETYGFRYNLTVEDYGKTFSVNGNIYTFVGLKPRSPKYPVIGKNASGKLYKFGSDVLKRLK